MSSREMHQQRYICSLLGEVLLNFDHSFLVSRLSTYEIGFVHATQNRPFLLYTLHPRELVDLDKKLDNFRYPAVVVLEYDEDGVDPLPTLQVHVCTCTAHVLG